MVAFRGVEDDTQMSVPSRFFWGGWGGNKKKTE